MASGHTGACEIKGLLTQFLLRPVDLGYQQFFASDQVLSALARC